MKVTEKCRVGEWWQQQVPSYWCYLYIAGDIHSIESVCRDKCFEIGLCDTVEPVKYIFTGGAEDGARIGLLNYARFPDERENIYQKAVLIGYEIAEKCNQWSFTIIDDVKSEFYSRRGE